jgi:hypothetical protein
LKGEGLKDAAWIGEGSQVEDSQDENWKREGLKGNGWKGVG